MIVGSTKEDLTLEKRVSLTPETAKNLIGLGLEVCVEKDYANHLGIKDENYTKVGVKILNSSDEILNSCDLLIKVNQTIWIFLLNLRMPNFKKYKEKT